MKRVKKQVLKNISPPAAKINEILLQYQNGQYIEAEILALSITKKFPKHPFGWKALGAILKQRGKTSESLLVMQKTVYLSPQDAEAHSNLGVTLHELGRLKEAEASLRQAIALKSDFAEAHYNLGNTLKDLGRLEDAIKAYKISLSITPDFSEAWNNIAFPLQAMKMQISSEETRRSLYPENANSKYAQIEKAILNYKLNLGGGRM